MKFHHFSPPRKNPSDTHVDRLLSAATVPHSFWNFPFETVFIFLLKLRFAHISLLATMLIREKATTLSEM